MENKNLPKAVTRLLLLRQKPKETHLETAERIRYSEPRLDDYKYW